MIQSVFGKETPLAPEDVIKKTLIVSRLLALPMLAAALFSADILEDEFVDWVQGSHLLKRAFREVAVIGGLVERQHPGKRKTGRQVISQSLYRPIGSTTERS